VSHPASKPPADPAGRPTDGPAAGSLLVVGLLALAAGLGAFAVWFQWGQTRRSLAFFGAAAARQIQTAPRVELWSLAVRDGVLLASERHDVSAAPGLVHLRRGLVEDVNYRWAAGGRDRPGADEADAKASERSPAAQPLPADAWDVALAFSGGADGQPATILAFELDDDGALTVVGRPGRLALGRIGPGLRDWITATKARFLP
jgi:hypothetical protein